MQDNISNETKTKVFDWDIETYCRLKQSRDEAKILGQETDWIESRMERIRNKYI